MLATIYKEFLLLFRDLGGLLLLIFMPVILIIVMATVQDAPFKDYQDMQFEMLVVNEDKGYVSKSIISSIKESKNFKVVDSLNGSTVNRNDLNTLIKEGTYQFGIILPATATSTLVNTSNKIVNSFAKSNQLPAFLPQQSLSDTAQIQIFFDPTTKPTFKASLTYALEQYIMKAKMEILFERLAKVSEQDSLAIDTKIFEILAIKEVIIGDELENKSAINSVQHNVPAWAIFGMFMIVVPIAGNMIRERDEGSAIRLKLIPYVSIKVALGRIIFYICISIFQFSIMLLVGLYFLPLIGLDRLSLGAHPGWLIPMMLTIAFTATSYGVFIGTLFKTANQAMPFGAISIVLLSAIGGVWVPMEILPPFMQSMAKLSPMYWSLEGVNNIFLRNNSWDGVLYPIGVLLSLSLILSLFSIWFRK